MALGAQPVLEPVHPNRVAFPDTGIRTSEGAIFMIFAL
jgi:hypothetical protein